MGLKSLFVFFLVVGALSAGLLYYCCPHVYIDLEPPHLPDEYYGRGLAGQQPKDNTAIKKFEIHVEESAIQDLKSRLARTRFVEPLDNVAFQYGFHAATLKKVVDYWRTTFDWRKQEKLLNKFSHFTTEIEGLKVHFIHEKPVVKGKKVRVLPLILIHGWPGSIAEFTKILPLLTTPRADRDYVFEVICPSIPGFGFSEAPHKTGFSSAAAARVFSKLMERLGFKKYYVQGGDWGASIASIMSKIYPQRVVGVHFNMIVESTGPIGLLKYAVGYLFPSLFMSPEEHKDIYPPTKKLHFFLEESGYFHIQATKPDTIGAALIDSPAGLAAYILEKFSTASGLEHVDQLDGGLTEKFTMDELLTNIMIYWSTNSSATSVRFYKEFVQPKHKNYEFERVPLKVPSGVAMFPNEILCIPRSFLTHQMRKLVRYERMPRGGHFAALEEPQLLSDEIWNFVIDVEKSNKITV